MSKAGYKVFVGDVNGDGRQDILVKATPQIVMISIDDDLDIPIPIPSPSPNFVLLSNAGGSYTLAASPDAKTLAFAWTQSNYALSFTGASGSTADSMSLKAPTSDLPSFVVSMTGDTGQLQLTTYAGSSVTSSSTPLPVAITPPHLQNPDAGTLPGALNVSPNGAATYSMPIEVPPGTNTVQPNLTLNYDGQGLNGPLGLGWTLGGMSKIHRCGQTIAQDGTNERISFSKKDRLCLDGQRLVLVNKTLTDDNYWANGAAYRTEIESFTRVKAVQEKTSDPLTFTVETKDGRVASYGVGSASASAIIGTINGGTNATQPTAKSGAQFWAIDRVQDRVGNYITFAYEQDGTTGEHRPTFIRYGGSGLASHAAVQFVYEARPDAWKRYIDETRNDLRTRIAKIRTYIGDDLNGDVPSAGTFVREYSFTYEQSPTSGRSLLAAVTACARNPQTSGRDCLPATQFNWGKPDSQKAPGFVSRGMWKDAPILTTHNIVSNSPRGANHADYFAFSDFDHDGLGDVLEKRVASVMPSDYSTADGQSRESSNPIKPGTLRTQYRYFHNTGNGFVTYTYRLDTGEEFAVLNVGDFNGDGALDLFVSTSTNTKICLSPLTNQSALGSPNTTITFTCGSGLGSAWGNRSGGYAYTFDPFGDGRSAAYSTIKSDGTATLCNLDGCKIVTGPPQVVGYDDQNAVKDRYTGARDYAAREFVTFTQMVDFGGIGKPYDVRWTEPYYETYVIDGSDQVRSGWRNLTARISMTDLRWPDAPRSVVADYVYPPIPFDSTSRTLRAPYTFDKPYQGNALSADFNGAGYNSLMFGYIEIGWDKYPQVYNKRAEATLCLSTGRALDCSIRQKYSGSEYRAITAVGNFVGDGAPGVMVSPLVSDNSGMRPQPSGRIEMCRVMGEDTSGGSGTGDSNMVCLPWPGATLTEDASGAVIDQVYFMDFLGTGRTQLVYYHTGKYVNGVWNEDGRWEVFEPIDVARSGEALDRLVSVTNGLGATSSVQYVDGIPSGVVGSTGAAAYQYPMQASTPSGKIVRRLTVSNGVADARSISYQYFDAATHMGGRGSLGFRKVIATDEQTGFVTTTEYGQDWPRVGMVLNASTVAGGCTIASTANTPGVLSITQANNAVLSYAYISMSTVIRRDLDCSELGVTKTESTPDVWGNFATQKTTSTVSDETAATTTSTVYRNDEDHWLLGLPTHIEVTKSLSTSSSSITRTIDRDYDLVTGLLKQEIVEKGNATYQVTTDYARNANPFGLVSKKTQTWYDPTAKGSRARTAAEIAYDAKGRYPETVKNALGQAETQAFYPETGARKSIKDVNSLTTTWSADGFNRLIKETRPDGNETRTYIKSCQGECPSGAVVAHIIDNFHGNDRISVPQIQYSDSVGHSLRSVTWGFDGSKIIVDQRYDRYGRLQEKDWPHFENATAYLESHIIYDALDRVTETVRFDEQNSAHSSLTSYKGVFIELTNALGQKRVEERNVLGRARKVIDPNGKTTLLEYDSFGKLTKTVDPLQNVLTVKYDRLGRKVELYDPDLGHISYGLDPLGRVISQTSPKQRPSNQATRFEYDDLDRITARYETDLESHWVYDTATSGAGKLAEAYTQAGTAKDYRRVYTYDSLGRPAKLSQTLTDGTYTSTPDYDAWGRPIRQTYQRNNDPAKVFDSRYSSTGYLATIERGSLVLWKVNAQDANLRPTNVGLGNGLTQVREFNVYSGRMKTAVLSTTDGTARLQEGYNFDALGNVLTRLQYWDRGGFQEEFHYDNLNRLDKATVLGQTQQVFTYDDIGNLTSKTGVGTGAYQYPVQGTSAARPHAVQSIPSIGSFTYDDNGNLLSGAGRTISWTSFDMPLQISGPSSSSSFVYGAEHQRVRQLRSDGSSVVYAGAQEVEINAKGTTVKTYWPGGTGVEIDKPKASVSEFYWVHVDRLGSWIGLTDQNGLLKEKLAYDAWGKRRTIDGAPVNGTATPDNFDGQTDNRGFTGHEMLDQLDLVHMNGRVYDPLVSRFLSGDALVSEPLNGQSYNRYSYVLNNPTNLVDPTGYEAEPQCSTGNKGACDPESSTVEVTGAKGSGAAGGGAHGSGMAKTALNQTSGNTVRANNEGKTDPKSGGSGPAHSDDSLPDSANSTEELSTHTYNLFREYEDNVWGTSAFTNKDYATPQFYVQLKIASMGIPGPLLLSGYRAFNRYRAVKAALEVANAAREAGVKTRAASALLIGFRRFNDVSTGGKERLNNRPEVQEALDSVAKEDRSPFHGRCAEIGCLNQAFEEGVDPRGGTIATVNVRRLNEPGHGEYKPACESCSKVLEYFGVKQ